LDLADGIKFLLVDETDGSTFTNAQFDGIIGLMPKPFVELDARGTILTEAPEMLMNELYDDFLINHNMFSLYLSDITDFGNRSKLWFGGYDLDFIRSFNGFSGYTDS
jgi:hypothetical protein